MVPHLVRDGKTAGPSAAGRVRDQGDRLCAWMLMGRGEDAQQELVPISSPVRVLAETSDEHGRGYGRLLEWQDSAGGCDAGRCLFAP